MRTIKQSYNIKAPIQSVWQALVDPEVINEWGGGPAKMDDKVGIKFSLWGGDIYGKNIKVSPNKELVQEWFRGKWDKPSKVTFTLQEKGNKTEVNLFQEDVPEGEVEDIDEGWRKYYLGPLKGLLEK